MFSLLYTPYCPFHMNEIYCVGVSVVFAISAAKYYACTEDTIGLSYIFSSLFNGSAGKLQSVFVEVHAVLVISNLFGGGNPAIYRLFLSVHHYFLRVIKYHFWYLRNDTQSLKKVKLLLLFHRLLLCCFVVNKVTR